VYRSIGMGIHVIFYVCSASRVNLIVSMKLCLSYIMNKCHVYPFLVVILQSTLQELEGYFKQ